MELIEAYRTILQADAEDGAWVTLEAGERESAHNFDYLRNVARQRDPSVRALHLENDAKMLVKADKEFAAGNYRKAVKIGGEMMATSTSSPGYYLDYYDELWRETSPDDRALLPSAREATEAFLSICRHNHQTLREMWSDPPISTESRPPIGLTL